MKNNITSFGLANRLCSGSNGNKVIRTMDEVKEQVMSETAIRIGSLIKDIGSVDAFVNIMLYKPFSMAKLRLKCGEFPESDGIKLAFEIINKNCYPKTKKNEAIKFLSDLANKMKEIEQRLIKESNKKNSFLGSSEHIIEELLPAHRKEMASYTEQAEKMVKSGKLDSNPFV